MTDEAIKSLEKDDTHLFTHGACHIFAITLLELKKEEGYSLWGSCCGPLRARHIYVKKDELMVDVCGIRMEIDFLSELTSKNQELYTSISLTKNKLLSKEKDCPRFGPMNCWGHSLEEEFIGICSERAKKLIEDKSICYEVSVFLSKKLGKKIS